MPILLPVEDDFIKDYKVYLLSERNEVLQMLMMMRSPDNWVGSCRSWLRQRDPSFRVSVSQHVEARRKGLFSIRSLGNFQQIRVWRQHIRRGHIILYLSAELKKYTCGQPLNFDKKEESATLFETIFHFEYTRLMKSHHCSALSPLKITLYK